MAISEVNICNQALLKLGAKPPINSLTEGTENAIICNTFYNSVRDAVLRSHPWNCAEHRKIITPLVETPVFGYDQQFQLPTNPWCLRVLQVNEFGDNSGKWKVAGRRLLFNESTAKIIYTKRITDTNEFDALLIDVLVLKLALKMAMPLTNSESIQRGLIDEIELISLPEAKSVDGQEQSVQSMQVNTYIDAMF